MNKITILKKVNGQKIIISENEISNEQIEKVKASFAKIKADKKERMQKRFDEIPPIFTEILRYANKHTKSECLGKYPGYEKIVNSIIFGNEDFETTK
jgi:hypothetical protein